MASPVLWLYLILSSSCAFVYCENTDPTLGFEEMIEAEKKAEEEKKEAIRKIAQEKLDKQVDELKKQGLSDEEIRKELDKGILITPEEVQNITKGE